MRTGIPRSLQKPIHGPFAVSRQRSDGRWVVTLNSEGRDLVEQFLAEYRCPAALLRKICPGTYHAAVRVFDAEEVEAVCVAAVPDAARRHRGPGPDGFPATVGWAMRSAVSKAMRRRGMSVATLSLDGFGEDGDATFQPADCRRPRSSIDWDDVLRCLNPSRRRVLRLVVLAGLNFREVAERLGVSRNRAHQVYLSAIEELARRGGADRLWRAVYGDTPPPPFCLSLEGVRR